MRSITVVRSLAFILLGLALPVTAAPSLGAAPAQVGVAVSITVPPPDLPVYDQPACPADNYIWVPGYWAWDADNGGYYWVPGTWVPAPQPGFLWTPGYWSWSGASFAWVDGYWGPVVGFYGGVNYGFGYFGGGYVGGHWQNNHFYYNRAVNNVNVTVVHNVYNTRVENVTVNRVSYNGGSGGLTVRPTPQQEAIAHQTHVGPVAAQRQQVQDARSNRQLWASVNHGRPPIAATPRAGDFRGNSVVAAREAGTVHNRAAAPAAAKRVNPGTRGSETFNPPKQPNRSAPPKGNAAERTPPANTRETPENPRMNQQPTKHEQNQQKAEQRQEQTQEKQMRSSPAEQPHQSEREQRPAQPEQKKAQPQHETRAPAEKSAPESKDKKQE
jgi:WXXGXW repeat (2 copies)